MTAPASKFNGKNDYESINQQALQVLPDILEFLELETEEVGKEIQMLNPLRQDGDFGSFSINTETGLWADFADDSPDSKAKGGDVTSLFAYLKGLTQREAANSLDLFLRKLDIKAPRSQVTLKQPELVTDATDEDSSANSAASNTTPTPISSVVEQEYSPAKEGEPIPELRPALRGFGLPKHVFQYKDRHGRAIAAVCRYETAQGKTFRPYVLNRTTEDSGLNWQVGVSEGSRPLYNRDQIEARKEADIVICEGEKAAEAAAQLFPDMVATTTMSGAKSAAKSNFQPLVGRRVLVAPDNDAAGEAYCNDVIALARSAGATIVGVLRFKKEIFGKEVDGQHLEVPRGYDLADAFEAGWTAEKLRVVLGQIVDPGPSPQSGIGVDASPATSAQPGDVPKEFLRQGDGVYWAKPTKDGGTTLVWLSSRIEVVASTRTTDSQSWGTLVQFADPDGVSHQWCIPQSMFGSDLNAVWGTLLSMGCQIAPEAGARTQLAKYLQGCKPIARGLAVRQPGWFGDVFVFPDGSSYGSMGQLISFETRDPLQQQSFLPTGTLEDWTIHLALPCVGNSRMVLAVCAALTGPLLHVLGEENAGLHFRGPSSIGKTTILRVACSVFGHPVKVMKTWRATANGLEGVASQHNDLLLPLDEFGEISPHDAAAAAYMLANGRGKVRASVSGSARAIAQWRLVLLSTGEIGLADHLRTAGIMVRAGQETRLIDIEADARAGFGLYEDIHGYENGAEFSRALSDSADRFHGCLGRALVEHLANHENRTSAITFVRSRIRAFEDQVVTAGSSGQVLRVAHRLALIAAVGELAIHAGLLTWPEGQADWAARKCLDSWIDRRGGTSELEQEQACDRVRSHLERFGDRNFRWRETGSDLDMLHGSTEIHGYKRRSTDGRTEYLILPSAFRDVICTGIDAKSVVRHLFNSGMLIPDHEGKSTQSIRLPDGRRARLYVINPNLLGEATPEDSPGVPGPAISPGRGLPYIV